MVEDVPGGALEIDRRVRVLGGPRSSFSVMTLSPDPPRKPWSRFIASKLWASVVERLALLGILGAGRPARSPPPARPRHRWGPPR